MFSSISSPVIQLASNTYTPRFFQTNNHPSPCGLLYQFSHEEKVSFLPSSSLNWRNELFISDRRGNVFRIDLKKGEYALVIRFGAAISCMASSPLQPSELLVASQQTNKLSLFKVSSNGSSLLSTLPRIHNSKITHVEFHPKSRMCLSVSEDCVVVWDTLNLQALKKLKTPRNAKAYTRHKFMHAAFFQQEVVTSVNDFIYIWDLRTFELKKTLELPPNTAAKNLNLAQFQISPDQNYLVTGGANHPYMSLWSYRDSTLQHVFALPYGTNGISKLLISPNSEECLILTREGKVLCIRLCDFCVKFELFASTSYYLNITVSHDWKLLELHSKNGLIQVYDLEVLKDHQEKLVKLEEYALSSHEDSRHSIVKKYLSSVEPNRSFTLDIPTGSDVSQSTRQDASRSISKTRESTHNKEKKSVKFNNFVSTNNLENISPSTINIYNISAHDEPTESQYLESKKSAFKKTVPTTLNTSKWTTKGFSIPNSIGREDVKRRMVVLPKGNTKELALNYEKLKYLLLMHGEYPAKYRTLAWRFLLSLPENSDVYLNLLKKGPHMATKDLHTKFPLHDGRLFRRLEKTLSTLMHYSPAFACSDTIPELVFPFLKVFKSDLVSIFETVVTFYHNWGKEWLEVVPNTPYSALDMVERILEENDPSLLDTFKKMNITSEVYAWTLLKSLFSQVFSKDAWLKLFDHVFTMPIIFLYYFTVSYLIYFRRSILHFKSRKDFEFFFQNENPCDINKIIQKTYDLMKGTDLSFPTYEHFEKLPLSFYPVVSEYPKQIVQHRLNNREEILRQEKETRLRKQRFSDEERYRFQPDDSIRRAERRNEALREAERIAQQELHSKNEDNLRRKKHTVDTAIQQKGDLIQNDQEYFRNMEKEISLLRSNNEELQRSMHLPQSPPLDTHQNRNANYEPQLQKSNLQPAMQPNQSQLVRAVEGLKDQIDNVLQEYYRTSTQEPTTSQNKGNFEEVVPTNQIDNEKYKQETTEDIAIRKYPIVDQSPSNNIDVNSERSDNSARKVGRPEDPVGRQLATGIVSPPPKPLKSPENQNESSLAGKKRPQTQKLRKKRKKKIILPKAMPTSPSDSSTKDFSAVTRSVSQVTSDLGTRPTSKPESGLSTVKGKDSSQKKAILYEQNRYIREKFLNFMKSRGSITGETPSKSNSSLTEYPWMEELSDSISISDSYSLGDESTEHDSILGALEEKRPLQSLDLNIKDSSDFTFIEDDDMITTLPSETLGDFTVPSGLKSDISNERISNDSRKSNTSISKSSTNHSSDSPSGLSTSSSSNRTTSTVGRTPTTFITSNTESSTKQSISDTHDIINPSLNATQRFTGSQIKLISNSGMNSSSPLNSSQSSKNYSTHSDLTTSSIPTSYLIGSEWDSYQHSTHTSGYMTSTSTTPNISHKQKHDSTSFISESEESHPTDSIITSKTGSSLALPSQSSPSSKSNGTLSQTGSSSTKGPSQKSYIEYLTSESEAGSVPPRTESRSSQPKVEGFTQTLSPSENFAIQSRSAHKNINKDLDNSSPSQTAQSAQNGKEKNEQVEAPPIKQSATNLAIERMHSNEEDISDGESPLALSYVDELLQDMSDNDEDVSIDINDYISEEEAELIESDRDAFISITTSDVMNGSTTS